jgi:aryl-alcohol dehydrogenase-like predicted oxidoreductase
MYFGSQTSEEDAFAILDTFVEAGGNLIDTADVYVGGVSEQIMGAGSPHGLVRSQTELLSPARGASVVAGMSMRLDCRGATFIAR